MPNPSTDPENIPKALRRGLAVAVALFASYYMSAWTGLQLASIEQTVTLLWPASGLAVGILYRFRFLYSIVVFFAAFAVNAQVQQRPIAFGISTGNAVAAALCAHWLKQYRLSPRFDHWRDGQTLGTAALAAMLIS